jgi:hypothetical protein
MDLGDGGQVLGLFRLEIGLLQQGELELALGFGVGGTVASVEGLLRLLGFYGGEG